MSLLPWIFIAGGLAILFAMHRWFLPKSVHQSVIVAQSAPGVAHHSARNQPRRAVQRHDSAPTIHLTMRVLVSLIVLSSALFIILRTGSSDAEQKWAFGVVGTILGYWLRA